MKELFLLNTKTHRLHVKGYCQHTRGLNSDFKKINSEDEALAFDGRALGLCKICQKKRELGGIKK